MLNLRLIEEEPKPQQEIRSCSVDVGARARSVNKYIKRTCARMRKAKMPTFMAIYAPTKKTDNAVNTPHHQHTMGRIHK